MLVDIDKIIVGDRIRRDFGDLNELAENIKKNGLLNPITINSRYVLLAGERRLRACKMLGWAQVDVRMVESEDEAQDIEIEMSENTVRRNFTGSELAEGIRRQMAIEAEKAEARNEATRFGGGGNISTTKGKARDMAGAAFGISGKQAEKVLYVADNADLLDPADFESWDEGRLSTNKAFQKVKEAQRQAEQQRDEALDELEEAYHSAELMEAEVASLRRQVAEKPQPEIVEREVVPSDYEKIKRENERLTREYQELWRKKRNVEQKLDEANELLGEKDRDGNAQRDIEHLTIATNTYLRNYGGKAWAFDQFYRVDETTQDEFRKAITNLASFAQNLVQLIQDRNLIGE